MPRETESPMYATLAHDVFAEPTCTVVDVLVEVLVELVVEVTAVVTCGDVERVVGLVGKGPSSTGGAVDRLDEGASPAAA
jgi:hypothetical protein